MKSDLDANPPLPRRSPGEFAAGEEICRLGRDDDRFFEVIDPDASLVRSLMTGEDHIIEEGFFLLISEWQDLPPRVDLSEAVKGDLYRHFLDGTRFQVLSDAEETSVQMLDLDSGRLSLHSRYGAEHYYKITPDTKEEQRDVHPVDDDGQFLLFDFDDI